MANVIPDTNDVAVAKIAAALYLIGNISTAGSLDKHLRDFGKAYKIISEVVKTHGDTNVSILLSELSAPQKAE